MCMNTVIYKCVDFMTALGYPKDGTNIVTSLAGDYLSSDSLVSSKSAETQSLLCNIIDCILQGKAGKFYIRQSEVGVLNVISNLAQYGTSSFVDHGEDEYFFCPESKVGVFISHDDTDTDGSGCSSLVIRCSPHSAKRLNG
jgi:hypothetical protein